MTDKYVLKNGWICVDTGVHNCVGGTVESSGLHEPHCGLEPVVPLKDLERLCGMEARVLAECDRIEADGHGKPIEVVSRAIAEQFRAAVRGGA